MTDPGSLWRRSLAAPQSTLILSIIPVLCLTCWNGVACWFWPRLMHLDFTDLRKEIRINESNWIKQNNIMKYREQTGYRFLDVFDKAFTSQGDKSAILTEKFNNIDSEMAQ